MQDTDNIQIPNPQEVKDTKKREEDEDSNLSDHPGSEQEELDEALTFNYDAVDTDVHFNEIEVTDTLFKDINDRIESKSDIGFDPMDPKHMTRYRDLIMTMFFKEKDQDQEKENADATSSVAGDIKDPVKLHQSRADKTYDIGDFNWSPEQRTATVYDGSMNYHVLKLHSLSFLDDDMVQMLTERLMIFNIYNPTSFRPNLKPLIYDLQCKESGMSMRQASHLSELIDVLASIEEGLPLDVSIGAYSTIDVTFNKILSELKDSKEKAAQGKNSHNVNTIILVLNNYAWLKMAILYKMHLWKAIQYLMKPSIKGRNKKVLLALTAMQNLIKEDNPRSPGDWLHYADANAYNILNKVYSMTVTPDVDLVRTVLGFIGGRSMWMHRHMQSYLKESYMNNYKHFVTTIITTDGEFYRVLGRKVLENAKNSFLAAMEKFSKSKLTQGHLRQTCMKFFIDPPTEDEFQKAFALIPKTITPAVLNTAFIAAYGEFKSRVDSRKNVITDNNGSSRRERPVTQKAYSVSQDIQFHNNMVKWLLHYFIPSYVDAAGKIPSAEIRRNFVYNISGLLLKTIYPSTTKIKDSLTEYRYNNIRMKIPDNICEKMDNELTSNDESVNVILMYKGNANRSLSENFRSFGYWKYIMKKNDRLMNQERMGRKPNQTSSSQEIEVSPSSGRQRRTDLNQTSREQQTDLNQTSNSGRQRRTDLNQISRRQRTDHNQTSNSDRQRRTDSDRTPSVLHTSSSDHRMEDFVRLLDEYSINKAGDLLSFMVDKFEQEKEKIKSTTELQKWFQGTLAKANK